MQIPALLQILAVFALVVTAAARKVHLGLAAALGGVALGFLRGMGAGAVARTLAGELLSADLLLLLAVMSTIMLFSSAMKRSGAMASFASAIAEAAPSKRTAMAIAPMLIGTLPVPGGAILSAPLVESMDKGGAETADSLAAANYWFRHTLELVWPLYPAFILTSSLSGFPAAKLAAINFYAPFLVFALGLVFVLPRKGGAAGAERKARPPIGARLSSLAAGTAPLAVVLGCYLLLSLIWGLVSPALALDPGVSSLAARYLPILLGLVAGCLFLARRSGGAGIFAGGFGRDSARLLSVLVGIRVFSALLGAAALPRAAAAELAGLGIPAMAAAALIPFIAGLVTGVGFGYVGLAIPIVLGLFPPSSPVPLEAAIALACGWGYAGMMLSPLHVCMVVSAEHFGTGLPSVIRRLSLPLLIFSAAASLYASALSALLA